MTTVARAQKVENPFPPTDLPAETPAQARGRIANDYAIDPLARLKGTWLLNSAEQTLNFHGYEHNLRNDITRHTRTDAVGSGGQSAENLVYAYDDGWNMIARGVPRVDITSYTVNDRNQVTGMTDGTTLGYDAHGNLLGQDNWDQQYGLLYTYDAENRLTRVEEDTFYIPEYAQRTDFVYDGLGRLRIRREYLYASGWALTGETRYIYDGRRVIQERSSANTPTVTYTRGCDLSGSLEGAGGIGGMLARSHGYSGSTGGWSTHNYYHADAGGNITCLINAGQSITAIYRYDPFGRTLFQSGTMANANVYRFSSKEVHGFTGMYYYGFRFYDPGLQRWINRDPIGERYDVNLYRYIYNSPLDYVDPDGLTGWALYPPQGWFDPSIPALIQSPEYQQGFEEGRNRATQCLLETFVKPIDLALTARDIYEDPADLWNYAGIVLPGTLKRAAKELKRVRDAENALDKLNDIEEAQRKVRKGGFDGKAIDSTKKTKQKAENLLKDIANDPDCLDDL